MLPSMVDYVLERGQKDYGQFQKRDRIELSNALNQRRLLEYLFSPQKQIKNLNKNRKGISSISDLKYSEILTQLAEFSEKVHNDIKKRNIILDGQIFKVENQWYKKKIPEFYCYYFLKFAYANPVHKLQKIIFQQMSNMTRQNDTYTLIRKAIQARQSCLANIKKQSNQLNKSIIQQDLRVIQQQINIQTKLRLKQQMNQKNYSNLQFTQYQAQKTWKNRIQLFFDSISHLRKLTLYIVDSIRKWKNHIYSLTSDPKRYRQRIIFYNGNINYLLKILIDNRFLVQTTLKNYLNFGDHYDPFLLKPLITFQSKKKTTEQLILYNLLKPKQNQMDKIVKCLQILAQQQYDQDMNSKYLNQKKQFGQLDFKKSLNAENQLRKSRQKLHKANSSNPLGRIKKSKSSLQNRVKINSNYIKLVDPLKSGNKIQNLNLSDKKNEIQFLQTTKNFTKNRNKNMSSVDLKKISPYLSRNQKIDKAKQIMQQNLQLRGDQTTQKKQIDRKIKLNLDIKENIKKIKDTQKSPIASFGFSDIEELKKTNQNKIFNKYIQENLKKISQSQKKRSNKSKFFQIKFNNINKQVEEKKQKPKEVVQQQVHHIPSGFPKGIGSKTIIQISDQGIIKRQKHLKISNPKIKRLGQSRKKTNQKSLQKLNNSNKKIENQNPYQNQKKPQILVLRQQPQKLQQIKNFLYAKIKQQLMQQLGKQNDNKQQNINNLIEDQKRKRISQIIEKKKLQQQKKKRQQQRKIKQQIQIQRNRINPEMTVQLSQYSQQNLNQYIQFIFNIQPFIFNTLFDTNQANFLKLLNQNLYNIFFNVKLKQQTVGYAFVSFNDNDLLKRKFAIQYLAANSIQYFISIIHHVLTYIWSCDPAQEIQIVLIQNSQSAQGTKMILQLQQYAHKNGQIFQKQLYANMIEKKFIFLRNYTDFPDVEFNQKNNLYSKNFVMKIQLLSANYALNQEVSNKMDLNLQQNTDYIFLIQQLFRGYLTPEQVIQLRQNTQNLRRLKDIFKVILELQKNKPKVHELKILEGINMQDLVQKIRINTDKPYEKYFWKDYHDKIKSNRLILAILEAKIQFPYPVNSAKLNDKNFFRIRTKEKILLLKSSVYPQDLIYILPTKNQKLKFFILRAGYYKQMRIEMFTFLNLLFNNIVFDDKHYIDSIWLPQINVSNKNQSANKFCKKQITRITDFSITMKKNLWLGQEIYFCNKQYLKNGISIVPQELDQIFLDSFIYGVIHSDIEKQTVGVPIFAKLIQKQHLF